MQICAFHWKIYNKYLDLATEVVAAMLILSTVFHGCLMTGIIDEVADMVEPLHKNILLQKYFASVISKPGNDLLKFSDEVYIILYYRPR